jgi:hypothetical protein
LNTELIPATGCCHIDSTWTQQRCLFIKPFPRNRSLQLRHGPHRKHFCIADHPCMLDCLPSCCLATP